MSKCIKFLKKSIEQDQLFKEIKKEIGEYLDKYNEKANNPRPYSVFVDIELIDNNKLVITLPTNTCINTEIFQVLNEYINIPGSLIRSNGDVCIEYKL